MNLILLYDCERDKDLKVGEAILVFEDGTTRRVKESSLYPKGENVVRESIKKGNPVRSRLIGNAKHREKHFKQLAPKRRAPLYPS